MHMKAMQNESVSALNGLLESDYHKPLQECIYKSAVNSMRVLITNH